MAMRFEHEFTVPVPVERAWTTLLDVERVAPCLPGATLETVKGDDLTGQIRVKVGPITLTYRGKATFEEVDERGRTLTIQASGKETRGPGTASATVVAHLRPEEERTRVTVDTSFTVTGRPAQFGRGVMSEVGARLIERFAKNLSELLQEPRLTVVQERPGEVQERAGEKVSGKRETSETAGDIHPTGTSRTSRTPDEEALDLLEVAGMPLLKRIAPIAGGVAVLVLAGWLLRRALCRRAAGGH
ncbi:SRPBCC family protein [Streptosporangium saharense]|uniref:Carbon monoxide dehydrogenase subunit G n=1 Tax=Streptosporangium saharense TaxID=1706840 RepID=A0A7W7VKU1_9ACTN|nr:SRPBCC family protein [Streptosporangium saharense]MBB4914056.1 carbon monoxide dehydrogenase subunit G [Streptosporangium saharense]